MKQVVNNSGMPILSVLGIVFVVLKLLGQIDWSWWLVLLPFWGGFALIFTIFFLLFVAHSIIGRR